MYGLWQAKWLKKRPHPQPLSRRERGVPVSEVVSCVLPLYIHNLVTKKADGFLKRRYLKIILKPVKALILWVIRLSGYELISNELLTGNNGLYKKIGDLLSFRKAAEKEIYSLKEQHFIDSDEVKYLKIYLDTASRLIDVFKQRHQSIVNNDFLDRERYIWDSVADIASPDRGQEYPSCRWVEGGLSFIQGRLRVCPNCVEDGGTPGLMRFASGQIPVREILRLRKLIILANQNGGFSPCNNCVFRTKKRWEPKQHLFDIICIAHSTACNLICEYCYSVPEKRYLQPLSGIPRLKPTFEHLIENSYLSPKSIIQWGGGEPTIVPEFDELFNYLGHYGVNSEVYSNGVKLSKIVLNALAANQAGIMISLDAGTRRSYAMIKGKDHYGRVVANIATYAAANPYRTIMKMIISRNNVSDVTPFFETAERAGVRVVCYDVLMYQKHIDHEVIDASALFCYESEKRGLQCLKGEVGFIYRPGDKIDERIDERLQFYRRNPA